MKSISKELLHKYIRGECTKEEIQQLLIYLSEGDIDFELIGKIQQEYCQSENSSHIDKKLEALLSDLQKDIVVTEKVRRLRYTYLSTIAASLLLFILSYTFYKRQFYNGNEHKISSSLQENTGTAYIKLGNGNIFHLDAISLENKPEEHPVYMDSEGFISLEADVKEMETLSYNTLKTPSEGIVRFVLPDGSKLWLNANSELEFPDKFSAGERRIKLVGEAYFEIEKSDIPFMIETSNQELKVLGTQFNLSSYEGDASDVTTLIEGSVRVVRKDVNQKSEPLVLKRKGEQSIIDNKNQEIVLVDVDSYIGWKEGWFIFHELNLYEMCKQIANWYGLELDYRVDSAKPYYGEIRRDAPLQKVINLIEDIADVKIIHQGRTLKVYK